MLKCSIIHSAQVGIMIVLIIGYILTKPVRSCEAVSFINAVEFNLCNYQSFTLPLKYIQLNGVIPIWNQIPSFTNDTVLSIS